MEFTAISVAELWNMIGQPNVYIVDLRERREFGAFHLKGAVNYPYERMHCWESELPQNKKIILCCDYGNLSMLAAKKLARKGYHVYTLIGGLNALNG